VHIDEELLNLTEKRFHVWVLVVACNMVMKLFPQRLDSIGLGQVWRQEIAHSVIIAYYGAGCAIFPVLDWQKGA